MTSTSDDDVDAEAQRAHELHALGLRQRDAGAFAAALGTFEATRTIEERLPSSSRRSWDLGMTLHELGWLHAQRGDLVAARVHYEQARDAKQRAEPAHRDHDALSTTLHELGVVYAATGMPAEAIEALTAALAANAQMSVPGRDNADAASLEALAQVHIDTDGWTAAVDVLSRALDVLQDPARRARALYWRAYALVELEAFAAAEASAAASHQLYSEMAEAPHEHHAEVLRELAFLVRRRGDRSSAAHHLWAARAVRRRRQPAVTT